MKFNNNKIKNIKNKMSNKNSRSQHPSYSVNRIYVSDAQVDWKTLFPDYISRRPHYEHQAVTDNLSAEFNKWAEAHNLNPLENTYLVNRITYINGYPQTLKDAGIQFDEYNIPMNPMGRTGMWGPGLLGKNGPNHAADPIVTRWAPVTIKPLLRSIYNLKYFFTMSQNGDVKTNPLNLIWQIIKSLVLLLPHLQMIAIQRRDTKDWAIPGGMVEAGQTVTQTLRNEINEEACNNMNRAVNPEIDLMFDRGGRTIYRGYVDDPRNTDSRWMETTAVHFHCPEYLAKAIKLEAGDDAQKVQWLDMTLLEPRYRNLYASHKMMTDIAKKHILWKYYAPRLFFMLGYTILFWYVY